MTKKTSAADPVAATLAALETARAALKAGEKEAAIRRETVHRLTDAAVDDPGIDLDAAADEIAKAESASALAEGRLPRLRETVTAAEAAYRRLHASEVLARVSAMSEVNGEALRDAVAALEAGYALAEADAWRTLRHIHVTKAEALAEAKGAGIDWIERAVARTDRGLIRPRNSLVPAVLPTAGSPQRIIEGVRSGAINSGQYHAAAVIESADAVPEDAAIYARELLGHLAGETVQPLADFDPANDDGLFAAIRDLDVNGDAVTITATVTGDRANRLPRHDSARRPAAHGPVLLVSARGVGTSGYAATVIDPRGADSVDGAAVAEAVTAALAAFDLAPYDAHLAELIADRGVALVASAKATGPDSAAVTVWRSGTVDAIPQSVPLDAMRRALINLPIAGAGIIADVTRPEGWRYALEFTRGDAEVEAA